MRAALATPAICAIPNALSQPGTLEEIVVTATRRETNLQDVPISVIAITGDDLEMRGMDSVESLSATVPNLNIIGGLAGPGTTSFTVRGIPRVGTYIDGVWQVGTRGLLTRQFVDLERVEVLARSAGHAVRPRFHRRRDPPRDEATRRRSSAAQINATVGNLDRRDVTASVDMPFTDKLRSKWTAASLQRDGYIQSLTVDQKYGAHRRRSAARRPVVAADGEAELPLQLPEQRQQTTEARVQSAVFPELSQTFGIGVGARRRAARGRHHSALYDRGPADHGADAASRISRGAGRCSGRRDRRSRFPTRSLTSKFRWK